MIHCKIIQCPKTPAEAERFFKQEWGQLFDKHVAQETKRCGEAIGLDVPAFMAAWEQRGITFIMAYEDGKPVGFMVGFVYHPLFYPKSVMLIERWYTESHAVTEEIFKYLLQILPVMQLAQVHISEHPAQKIPSFVKTDDNDSYHLRRIVIE